MVAENSADSKNEKNDILLSTQEVIKEALDKLGYPNEAFELMKEPMRMITVRIPVRWDGWKNKSVYGLPGTAQ